MKAYLLYIDKDFEWSRKLTVFEEEYIRDLGLETLFHAMSSEDSFIDQHVKKVITLSLSDRDEIIYRQDILRDCMANPAVINKLWNIAASADSKTKDYVNRSLISDYPKAILEEAADKIRTCLESLSKIRAVMKDNRSKLQSAGFINLSDRLIRLLPDSFFEEVSALLHECRFRNGMLLSGQPEKGIKTKDYSVLNSLDMKSKAAGFFKKLKNEAFTFMIDSNDTNSRNALSDIEQQGVSGLANILWQACEGISGFLMTLRRELAFYKGCLNLHHTLRVFSGPVCFPVIDSSGSRTGRFTDLYDPCTVLNTRRHAVGNSVDLSECRLLIITGANQGGKSTFLRSLGTAQIMLQCGMFVGAGEYTGSISNGVYTHFRNEEDPDMKSGKFDEELMRLNKIIDDVKPGATIFMNEAFAATNENEGTEIAVQVTGALLAKGIKLCFVTHFYEYAVFYYERHRAGDRFLVAERTETGERTFRMIEGEPKRTSFGMDIYKSVFKS
jgi:DNA mismatch repair ATPase MutS